MARRWGGLVLTLATLASGGCSIFQLGKSKSFGDWYVGPPGFSRGLDQNSKTRLNGKRSPIFGHFRLPEIIVQPHGGLEYPSRYTQTTDSMLEAMSTQMALQPGETATVTVFFKSRGEGNPEDSLAFDMFDGGLLEIIPYRLYTSKKGIGYKLGMTLVEPLITLMRGIGLFVRAPAYAIHDTVKILMIPVAAIYYGSGDEPKPLPKPKPKPKPPVRPTVREAAPTPAPRTRQVEELAPLPKPKEARASEDKKEPGSDPKSPPP